MGVDWNHRHALIEERRLEGDAIEALIEDLKADGLRLKEATYRGQMGGSWYFVFCGEACVRAAFDGRDGFLAFEVWKGRTEYELGDRPKGRWEQVTVYDPDLAEANAYTAASIRAEVNRIASAAA
jgi:hypothetical protein